MKFVLIKGGKTEIKQAPIKKNCDLPKERTLTCEEIDTLLEDILFSLNNLRAKMIDQRI